MHCLNKEREIQIISQQEDSDLKRGGHTDFILGIALCVTSLAYLLSARKIIAFTGPGAAPLDAKAIPYMWGGILFLLGISLIVRSCIRQRKRSAHLRMYHPADCGL